VANYISGVPVTTRKEITDSTQSVSIFPVKFFSDYFDGFSLMACGLYL
jgi:hypothetical protein